jgi:hypothetical protein
MAIAYDAGSSSAPASGSSSATFSHVVASGSDRILVVGTLGRSSDSNRVVTGVTYGGNALTFLRADENGLGSGNISRTELWYRVAPTAGTADVVVTFTGAVTSVVAAAAMSFTGVDQASPIDAQGTHAENGVTSVTTDITTVADNAWALDFIFQSGGADLTAGAGQTERVEATAVSRTIGMSTEGPQTPAGAVTMSWSWTLSAGAIYSLASLKPATGGDTTAPILTSPTGSATGTTTATVGATTDEGNGTMYAVVTTTATTPSAAQVEAGQNHTGAAAAWSGSVAVSSTGAKTLNATGLASSTAYYAHVEHKDAASNQSNVVTSSSFTTVGQSRRAMMLGIG